MTRHIQRRLVIIGAAAAIGLFLAANAYLVSVAVKSQPDCVVIEGAAKPAKRAC